MVRSNAPKQLRNILAGQAQDYRPTWRAVALNVLREQTFVTVPGTTAETWLDQRRQELQVSLRTGTVPNYDDRHSRPCWPGRRAPSSPSVPCCSTRCDGTRRHDLMVIDRQFTYEPLALAVARGDDDFRLFVDRSLSRFFNSPGFATTYMKWFGKPDETAKNFFRWNALPE